MTTPPPHTIIDLTPGFQLGHYTLLERIGRGGQAMIWSAWDHDRGRVVAMRLIPSTPGFEESPDYRAFEREAHLIASLAHPHILPLYEFGSAAGYHFFVVRYISSGSIADLLEEGPMAPDTALHLLAQVVSALEYIHRRGIVHRDLKPGNILIDARLHAYISDFGLARDLPQVTAVLHTGHGTAPYAPPEQHLRTRITPRSDVYSLGVMIYEMLTGELPWEGDISLALQQINAGVLLPEVHYQNPLLPPALTDVLRQLTAASPDDRPASAQEAFEMVCAAFGRRAGALLAGVKEAPDEVSSAEDAAALLAHYLERIDPLGPRFFITLTHFALINAACSGLTCCGQPLDARGRAFMLRGALLHNYEFDTWWGRLADDPETRGAVASLILIGGEDLDVDRVLAALASDLPDQRVVLEPRALAELVQLAAHARTSRQRADALAALERTIPDAQQWRPEGIGRSSDLLLAEMALSEQPEGQRAARLIGRLRSEAALAYLLERGAAGGRYWPALVTILKTVGSLPPSIPRGLRLRASARRLRHDLSQEGAARLGVQALIGLAAGLLITLLMLGGVFRPLDLRLRDALFTSSPVSGIVTIVAIDDASLEQFGRWEDWPRALHARLIERLHAAGARVIAFDVVFASAREDDADLAAAMREAGNVVLPLVGQGDALLDTPGRARYLAGVWPQAGLAGAGAALGHANVLHDPDGVIRRLPALIEVDGTQYLSLPLAAINLYVTGAAETPAGADGQPLRVGGRQVPVGPFAELTINYAGGPSSPDQQTFPLISYADVLAGQFDRRLVEGKIVLVGVMAAAEPDSYLTPVSRAGRPMFGVEILANALETVWARRFIQPPPIWVEALGLLALGLITGLLLRGRPWLGLAAAAALLTLYFLIAALLFEAGVQVSLLYPYLVITLTLIVVTSFRYWFEIRDRRRILRLFEARVAPQVAQAALDAVRRGEINLGGQVHEVTVAFADLHSLARFGETHTPEEVMQAANTFLGLVADVILDFEGTLAHYEGNRAMAIFNAPVPQPDHPLRAARMALAARARVEAYLAALPPDHPFREIDFSYGIYTGRAIVGHAGSAQRHEYTALGDTINVAARLTDMARPGQILMGAATYERVARSVVAAALPTIALRGRVAPIEVFELVEVIDEQAPPGVGGPDTRKLVIQG
ncbi:MAG: hypothetical protein Kow00124_29530 [Anaerolineae bacterium]